MSHFNVTVLLTAALLKKHNGDLDAALEEKLAPYQENNMGDCPKEFLEFNDTEGEMLEEYNTETRELYDIGPAILAKAPGAKDITVYNGRALVSSWHEMFRKPGSFGVGSDTHEVPPGIPMREIPFKDLYPTLEAFVKAWHGREERDPEKNRYGYWENPQKKWDWYQIGGRWTGKYPVKPGVTPQIGQRGVFGRLPKAGYADVVRLQDLDMDKVMSDALTRVNEFWTEYQDMLAGKKFPVFEGPRSQALDIGLLYVEQDPKAPIKDGYRSLGTWAETFSAKDDRAEWRDVVLEISKEDFIAKYFMCFNPIKTFAALDDKGWHAPGTMGWFGAHDSEADSTVEYANNFMDFIKSAGPDDLIVCVDCHI